MKTVVEEILKVCRTIDSDRDTQSIMNHLYGEGNELQQEIDIVNYGGNPGKDGILGEAVDVMLCAIDIIYKNYPGIDESKILPIVMLKLAKWQRLYGQRKTQEQILKEKMEDWDIQFVKPGFVNPEATKEQVCTEINKALDQIILGNFDRVE